MKKLAGKVAVITGGNSGIGLATAHLFREEGATVIVNARNAQRLAETREIVGEGIEMLVADVTRMDQLDAFFEQIGNQHGQIDMLFVNAGLAWPSPFESVEESNFDRTFNVNFKGAFFSAQKALPWMKDGSTIVFNTSIGNRMVFPDIPESVYSATKAALRSLTRSLAVELSPRGIRVNAVCPGPIATPFGSKTNMSPEEAEVIFPKIIDSIPLKRIGASEEIAQAVLFLASSDSSFVLGTELVVDGGLTQV